MSARKDWPFGTELERRRTEAGLGVREAARRAGISEGRWRQLESGVQKIGGREIPIKTRPATAAAVAKVVGWEVDDAVRTAGFDPSENRPVREPVLTLRNVSDEDLVREIAARLARARRALGLAQASGPAASRNELESLAGSTLLDITGEDSGVGRGENREKRDHLG